MLERLSFPELTNIENFSFTLGGGIMVQEGALIELNMPKLTSAESVNLSGLFNKSQTLSFPALQDVGRFSFMSSSAATGPTKIAFPKLETCENFGISAIACLEALEVPVLREVGNFNCAYEFMKIEELNLPCLKKATGFSVMSNFIQRINVPELVTITGNCMINATKALKEISMPKLTEITNMLTIGSRGEDPNLTNLDGFGALTAVKSVKITGYPNLTDFSGFKNVNFEGVNSWSVSGCGYNPVLEDMKNGDFVQ